MKKVILMVLLGLSLVTNSFGQDTIKYKSDDIFSSEDAFSEKKEIKYYIHFGPISLYRYEKFKSKNILSKEYYISLHMYNRNSLFMWKDDVTILFLDGTKLHKKVIIDCDVSYDGNGYNYSVFIPLLPNDIKILKTKKIDGYRFHTIDKFVTSEEGEAVITYANYIFR